MGKRVEANWNLLKDEDSFWEATFESLASGIPLTVISRTSGVKYKTMHSFISSHPELQEKYDVAKMIGADYKADTIDEIVNQILQEDEDGKINPHTARIGLDYLKWSAQVQNPAKYGDKKNLQIDQHVTISQQYVDQLREFSRSKIKNVTPDPKLVE